MRQGRLKRGRSGRLTAVLGRALIVTTALYASSAALAAPAEAPASEEEAKAVARVEVQAGSAAFQAGDFELAIQRYQAAMAILAAPKLHYNIGVCHQRLSLDAETPEERTHQRDLAIESYNAYLEQNPRAEDRLAVAQTIRDLGGAAVTMPRLKPLFEDDDQSPKHPEPGDGQPDPGEGSSEQPAQDEPLPSPPAPNPPPKTPPNHGRFGLILAGGFSPTLLGADAVDAKALVALDLHGGGFIGAHRRFLLAAHTAIYTGVTLRPDGLSFYGYSLGLLGQQTWVAGREAVQIGLGGVIALTGQGLSERTTVPPPLCSINRAVQVAGRTGALLGPRFNLGILLGARRRGMISILVQPNFAVFGDGPRGTACQGDETPWTSLGIRRRWQLQLWAGAGFSFRF